MECGNYPVLRVRETAKGFFDLWVNCPPAAEAAPGQFLSIRCGEKTLRRPISVCETDKAAGAARIVFEVRGEGTAWLSKRAPGEMLDILGPLGRGFDLSVSGDGRAVFVGGGIGAPPLLAAAKPWGERADVLLGFRSAGACILEPDFKKTGAGVQIATDDGSFGYHGLVTELLRRRLGRAPCKIVYACGPGPMLRAAAQTAAEFGVRCEVSLEERMACGVGACLCCAVPVRGTDGAVRMRHVCSDGPVFDAQAVFF